MARLPGQQRFPELNSCSNTTDFYRFCDLNQELCRRSGLEDRAQVGCGDARRMPVDATWPAPRSYAAGRGPLPAWIAGAARGPTAEATGRELPAEPEVVIANAAGRDHALALGRVALVSCRLSVRARAHAAAPADDRLDDRRASAPAPLSLLLLGERSHPGADASRQLGASR